MILSPEPMFSAAPAAAAFLAVSLVAAVSTAAPPREASIPVSGPGEPSVAWRFHAGGTLPGPPAVSADGTAYLGTSDGSFEAIGVDGVLRWSVTLEGSIAWSPVVDDSGRIYVATTAQRVHSFLPSGVRGWALRPPVRVAADPAPSIWGILLVGGDGSVWAISSRGAPLWHVETGQPLSAAVGAQGARIVAGTSTGDAVFFDGASRRFVAHLGNRIRATPIVFRDGSAAVLSGSSLFRLDQRAAILWRREGVDWVGRNGEALFAVNDRRELVWLSADGVPSRNVRLGAPASGPPVPGPDGTLFVPCDSGELVLVRPDGVRQSIRIASTPLYGPVLDAKRHRLLLAAGDGTVAAVALPE